MNPLPSLRSAALAMLVALVAAGCASRQPAPVADRTSPVAPQPARPEPARPSTTPVPAPAPAGKAIATHTVKRGDTLVGIALQYGLDYRELAAWNGIANANVISVGQVLLLSAPVPGMPAPGASEPVSAGVVATPLAGAAPVTETRAPANTDKLKVEPRAQKLPWSDKAMAQLSSASPVFSSGAPAATPSPVAAVPPAAPAAEPEAPPANAAGDAVEWNWPVKGKVIATFTDANKGIDIAGKKGTPVNAAASGRVVYAGQGLRGYGKLVIIKHSDTWLSAYAHNDAIHVKEQQEVKRGQKIAEMGATDADQVKLHFEVRRQGKPVDPAKVLPPS